MTRNYIGEKLKGKLHIFVGADDTFYLDGAVYEVQDFAWNQQLIPLYLLKFKLAHNNGEFFTHCFSGIDYWEDGSVQPNSITRLTYHATYFTKINEYWSKL